MSEIDKRERKNEYKESLIFIGVSVMLLLIPVLNMSLNGIPKTTLAGKLFFLIIYVAPISGLLLVSLYRMFKIKFKEVKDEN